MAKQWAKVHRGSMLSSRLAALYKKNKAAAALYWPLKAEADDFGRFRADPARFGVAVGGMAQVTAKQADKILTSMEECGLITFYEVNGDRHLEIVDYAGHDAPAWFYVGKAEYDPPPGWEPPADLVEFLLEKAGNRQVTPERYGIRPGVSAACDKAIADYQLRKAQLNGGPTEPEPQPNPSPTADEPQLNHSSSADEVNSSDVDVDVDVDVDSDNDLKGNDVNGGPEELEDQTTPAQPLPVPDPEPPIKGTPGPGGITVLDGYGSDDGLPSDIGALKQNHPLLTAAIWKRQRWERKYRDKWFLTLLDAVENDAYFGTGPGAEKLVCELLSEYTPDAEEKCLCAKWIERVKREEGNDAEVQDPTTIVKQYPVWKLEQGKTDNKGLTANNMTCTWDDPRNVLVAQLEEAVAHERTHA